MPEMWSIALKALPRDSYKLMTKYSTPASGDPAMKIDQFRKQLKIEYIDILLLHCLRPPSWKTDYSSLQDGFSEAKHKKVVPGARRLGSRPAGAADVPREPVARHRHD